MLHTIIAWPKLILDSLANAEMRLILAKLLWNFDIELPVESLPWINQKSFSLWKRPALMVNLLRAGRVC